MYSLENLSAAGRTIVVRYGPQMTGQSGDSLDGGKTLMERLSEPSGPGQITGQEEVARSVESDNG